MAGDSGDRMKIVIGQMAVPRAATAPSPLP